MALAHSEVGFSTAMFSKPAKLTQNALRVSTCSGDLECVVAHPEVGLNGVLRITTLEPAASNGRVALSPTLPSCALLCLGAAAVFRRGGDPILTQLRDPADELHRNRFGEWEVDRPLSQLIALEHIFERREERPRGGKQRKVFLEAREIQHRLSAQ